MVLSAQPPNRTPPKLLLASGSRYRQAQLQQIGVTFRAAPANVDESVKINETAAALACRLAREKALALLSSTDNNTLIIGSDQSAECRGRILGKPGSKENAVEQLSFCQNTIVTFHTALCVYPTGTDTALADCTTTTVKFRPLSSEQIEHYIEREQPLDCAGSFKCEGLGITLFEYIRSDDPSALIGLPLIRLTSFLMQLGFRLP